MKTLLLTITLILPLFIQAQDLPCKEKFYNGRCKERYIEDSNGQKHGKYILYLENGQVDKVSYYNHGKLNGVMNEFYDWGTITTTYLNDVMHGLYQKIEKSGKILDKGNYTKGVKTGYWVESQGMDKGTYVNGKKHGLWEVYYKGWQEEGGIAKGSFDNGDFSGTWTNLVLIGINEERMDPLREIALPDKYYNRLQSYFKKGFKVSFKDGFMNEAFDAKGNTFFKTQ